MKELVKYILELDFLTTKEFCEKYAIPLPLFLKGMSATELAYKFIKLDAIKFNMIIEKTKEISKRNNSDGEITNHLSIATDKGIVTKHQKSVVYWQSPPKHPNL